MKLEISTNEANKILDRANRKATAYRILNEDSRPRFLTAMTAVIVTSLNVMLLPYEAPLLVKILIMLGVAGFLFNGVENWLCRRRLEAAIELLKLVSMEENEG